MKHVEIYFNSRLENGTVSFETSTVQGLSLNEGFFNHDFSSATEDTWMEVELAEGFSEEDFWNYVETKNEEILNRVPKRKGSRLAEIMGGIANNYEDEGKKWNPITKDWA